MAFTRTGRLATTLAAAAALAAVAPVASQAAFKPPFKTPGTGSSISGIGSGMQEEAQAVWSAGFASEFPGLSATYTATNSGDGLNAFGATNGSRDATNRFAGTDEAPTNKQLRTMNRGDNPFRNTGEARTIPVASGSVAILVNFPAGCTIPADAAYPAGPVTATSQFVVSNKTLEKAFAGDPSVSTWGQLLPGITGDDFGTACADVPLTRVVRSDEGGTTTVLKRWLKTIDKSRGWTKLGNTEWPNDSGATSTVRSNTSFFHNGDTAEALGVSQNNGSIGYASLTAAYARGFDQSIGDLDNNFWIPIHDGRGDVVQPTRDADAITTATPGANCDNADYSNVPFGFDVTLDSWHKVTAAKSTTGYPLCSLTYDLAWDDSSAAYDSTSTTEEASQRTVKDYLGYVLSDQGQAAAAQGNYSALPKSILKIARQGQKQIGWNKR